MTRKKKSTTFELCQSDRLLALLDKTALADAWPSLDQDAARSWVLIGESIAVGIHQGKFDLGCLQGSEPVFMLIHESNWQISPAQKGPDSAIKIDGTTLLNTAPLAPGYRVEAEGLWFNLKEAH